VTDQIREHLQKMIPDLPHPPDRLEAIAARVRWARRRQFAIATAGTIAGVLAVSVATVSMRPTPVATPPPIACPAPPKYRVAGNSPQDRAAFVRTGARWAALCVYSNMDGSPRQAPPTKYLLHNKVERLTQVLNGLPPAKRCIDPGFTSWGPASVIVLAAPDRTTQVIQLNLACGAVANGQQERADVRATADTFYALYREQVAATIKPDSIEPAVCADQLVGNQLMPPDGGRGQVYDAPRDDILRDAHDTNWMPGESALPSPLATATLCRYLKTTGGLLRLELTWNGHTDLEQLRSDVNQIYQRPNGPGQQTSCMEYRFKSPQITTVDVLWLTDVTGRALEVRIARKPCAGVKGTIPLPALTTTVDRLLGTAP
jgi:hypothetical protein